MATFTFYVSCADALPVYINACGDSYADFFGYAFVTVRAMDSYSFYGNAVAVDTYVDSIYVTGDGSTSGTSGTYFGISSGNNCTTGYISGFNSDELIDGYNVVSISPPSSSTQIYNLGSGYRDSCWSC